MEIDLRLLLDTLPGLAWTAFPDGRPEYLGKPWLDYTGLTFEEAIGAGWIGAVHPDDAPQLLSTWASIIASGELGEVEARLRRYDGVYRRFLFRACPLPAPNGEVARWCGMNVDVDDRVRTEEDLRDHKIQLHRIFDGLPVIAGWFSPAGKVIACNSRMLDFLGRTLEEVQARPTAFDYHPDDHDETMTAWWAAVDEGRPFSHVARLRRWDGAFRSHRLLVDSLRNSAGEIEVLYGVASDIDDQVRAETMLAAEKQLLERVAKGVALPVVLDELARAVEALVPGCYCTILIVGEGGDHFKLGAAPTLPVGYKAILDGKDIDPDYGPLSRCIFEKAPVIVVDAENDPQWTGSAWPARMAAHGLHSSWTAPILAADGAALAAFAIYRGEPQIPTPHELELIDRFTHIAGIAIERAQVDAALKASEATLAGEKQLLELIASGAVLPVALKAISHQVETLASGAMCSVLVVDEGRQFHIGASPRLPAAYSAVLEGLAIDPGRGPFSLAVTLKAPVISVDLANDPRWTGSPWLALALKNGLAACWSAPILSAQGDALGAFVVYRPSPTHPTPQEMELIDRFAKIAGIAIERAQADAALQTSEAKLRQAYDSLAEAQQLSHTGSFVTDLLAEEHDWSDESYRIFGFDRDATLSVEAIRATILPEDHAGFDDMIARAGSGEGVNFTFRIVTPQGELKHVYGIARVIERVEGRPLFVGALQDVTQSKLVEEALRASQAELRRTLKYMTLAQQLSQTGSYARDVASDEQVLSEEMYRILEFDPATPVTHEMIFSRVHPEDRQAAIDVQAAAQAAGKDYNFAYRMVMPSGAVKHMKTFSQRQTDITDRLVYVGATQDVTDWRRAEEALRASQAELLQAYAHLNEAQKLSRTGSFTWDVERDEHNWSAEERRIFEIEPDAKVTLPMILEAIHPDDIPLAEAVIGGALQDDSFDLLLRIIPKSGLLKHVHVVGRRAEDITDRVVFLGAIQDITERKNAEEALDRARAELAHVSRAMTLSALTASIAHEVNQPLAGIITNASTGLRMLTVDQPNLEGVRATMQRTLRDGNRASEVIQRLRAMFARQSPSLEPVDLNDAAREVLAMTAGELQQRRVVLTSDFDDDLPAISGDRVQLQQVILNLVLNGADAMNDIEDQPRNLHIMSARDGPNEVKISVQDSGVGIEPDEVEQLFHAFYTTKPDGMGIGLAISRTIIENHEGRLWAAPNEDGPGATFSFSIPNQPASDRSEAQFHPEEGALAE